MSEHDETATTKQPPARVGGFRGPGGGHGAGAPVVKSKDFKSSGLRLLGLLRPYSAIIAVIVVLAVFIAGALWAPVIGNFELMFIYLQEVSAYLMMPFAGIFLAGIGVRNEFERPRIDPLFIVVAVEQVAVHPLRSFLENGAILGCLILVAHDPSQLFGRAQQRGGANGRARFAERHVVRVDHAQAREPEIRHGAGRGPHVQRVARRHQDHAEIAFPVD